jgi:hypothetical protein
MEYVHIRSLEKYHPGYRDRELRWAKLFFTMAQGDPDFELVKNEIDKWRFAAMICLELEAKKPLPNTDDYWRKKFDIKKRPMSLTLQMLHSFLEVVTQLSEMPAIDKSKNKNKNKSIEEDFTPIEIYDYYSKTIKAGAKEDAIKNITTLLKQGITKEDLIGRIDAYKLQLIKDKTEPQFYIQANNFFGKKARYKDFEPMEKPKLKPADKSCKLCKGTGFVYIPEISGNKICDCRKVK